MDSCDVLVIGGGPAGSTCARQLSRAGMDVMLIDKARFPRDKVCAGWITPGVVQLLELDAQAYGRDHALQPITGFRTGLIDGQTLETRYGETVSFGIRRCEFDQYLLQRAGARLCLGQPVSSLERRDGRWIVNDAFSAPLLIGAGGHFCPVARFLGAKLGADVPCVAAKEIEFAMDDAQRAACLVQPDTPELYFTGDLKGYGWCFRKGRYLNIGLGREDSHHLPEHLAAFCAFLARTHRIPPNVPDKFHGHAYQLYGHAPRKMIADGVLLVGDAAGLAYAESGEGIRPAIESAVLAAACIAAAGGNYRVERLQDYADKVRARFGPGAAQATMLPPIVRQMIAGLMLRNRWLTRRVVLDRWFLRSGQTALAR
jgi:geranylgeranyl reductase family protein